MDARRSIKDGLYKLFYSIAGCSATIIAIIGGFIASKLISISADRDNILDKINDELGMKSRQHNDLVEKINDDDAFDFVRDNISMLLNDKTIEVMYKTEEKPALEYSIIEKYWNRALKIYGEIANLDEDSFIKVNSDKVPVVLANKYTNEFDYNVCKKIIRKLGLRIEELKFEKKQYEDKKKQFKKPKGMKAGLCLFATFSVFRVFFSLICALINHMKTLECLCLPIISLALLGICTLITFIYLALLLKWKNVDMEEERHESNS